MSVISTQPAAPLPLIRKRISYEVAAVTAVQVMVAAFLSQLTRGAAGAIGTCTGLVDCSVAEYKVAPPLFLARTPNS